MRFRVAGLILLCLCGCSTRSESNPGNESIQNTPIYPETWPEIQKINTSDCTYINGTYEYEPSKLQENQKNYYGFGVANKTKGLDFELFSHVPLSYDNKSNNPVYTMLLYDKKSSTLNMSIYGESTTKQSLYVGNIPVKCQDGWLIYEQSNSRGACGEGSCETNIFKYKKISASVDGALVLYVYYKSDIGQTIKSNSASSSWYRYKKYAGSK